MEGSQILYFTCNRNGEAEVITVILRQVGTIKKLKDIDFEFINKSASKGNLV
jgi:topoisomerase-4 subunit A